MSAAPAPEYWLHGGVAFDKAGVARFIGEVERVILALGLDPAWTAWWRSASRAPVLELRLFVVRAWASPEAEAANRYAGVEDRVHRGRKQHVVQMVVSAEHVSGVSTDRQPGLALPVVLEGVETARASLLQNAGPPPEVPPAALAMPVPASVLRRERLAELLGRATGKP